MCFLHGPLTNNGKQTEERWCLKLRAWGYNWAALFLGDITKGNLALQVGGVSDGTVNYGYEFCATRTITLQIADQSSRQRGRPTETRPQI
jgi:hypothetical protein